MLITSYKKNNHIFGNQWVQEIFDHWDYEDFKNDRRWHREWISFNCGVLTDDRKQLLLGVTSFESDIFTIFDLENKQFMKTDIAKIVNPFDAKFHRSMIYRQKEGCYYAAIALLHDVDNYFAAPGGAIIRYNPSNSELQKIAIPIPNVYIQSIVFDSSEENIFGQCFAPEYAFKYNISSGRTTILGLLGSGYGGLAQSENIARDKQGNIWFNWSITRAWQSNPGVDASRLCKYDVCNEKMIFYPTGLPRINGSHGFAKVESFINLGDDGLYAGGDNGALYRIDTENGTATLINPMTQDRLSRLSSMTVMDNGDAIGVTGRDGNCQLFRFSPGNDHVKIIGDIVDCDGLHLWQCHDIISVGNSVYICENDNPCRSSYLWEVAF